MMYSAEILREIIARKMPAGLCVPEHTDKGHFYRIRTTVPVFMSTGIPIETSTDVGELYSSVTTKLQVLKDEGLMNYKMNRALDYVFANWKNINSENLQIELERASKTSADILEDAGDVGTIIHDCREKYFREWIETGNRPDGATKFIPLEHYDIRIVSALRALVKFVDENNYQPVASELLVWSHKLKVAGTLDDIGLMNGKPVLMDIKSSNQFKDHYFFQVALYFEMFRKLTGIKLDRCFILKLSKEDGTYKIEDLYRPCRIAQYAGHMLKTWEGLEFIRSLRKDNQKIVIKL